MEKISVIGAGSWGTTVANLLAKKDYPIKLWTREEEIYQSIKNKKENLHFLPGIKLSNNIYPTQSLKEAVDGSNIIITAVPSQFLRSIAKQFSKYISQEAIVVNLSKGLETKTFKRMSQVLEDEISKVKIIALSGPNHSEEVSRCMPTATTIASNDHESLKIIQKIFTTDYFKVYMHDDIVGVELCGAFKNITAIATGVCYGAGFGDNAIGSIITLGLYEMSKLCTFLGAKRATCYGLAGVGDLVATCTSLHSRNRFVGNLIAKGKPLEEIKHELKGRVAEGIETTKAVYELSRKNNIDMPLTTEIYKVLFEKKNLKEAISDLIYHA